MSRRRGLAGSFVALAVLAGLPWLAPVLPLPDPDELGDPTAESYLPPGSKVWCARSPDGARLCAPSPDRISTATGTASAVRPIRHWLGTDLFGRDLLGRVLAGARSSVRAALCALVLTLVLGCAAGLAAGMAPHAGWVLSFLSDLILSVPRLFLLAVAAAFYRPGPLAIASLIAATSWMGVARLVRAEARALAQRDFVRAARAAGADRARLALTHVLPHLRPTLLAAAVLRMPDLLLLDAALGFLGLAAPPPAATLGGLMGGAGGSLRAAWWLGVFPGLWVVGLALAFAALAESLRGRPEPVGAALL